MNINKNNYESWFLDYHEGTLSAEKVAELFLFLEKHQEFKNEFESFAQLTLPKTNEVFSFKDSLKKNTITSENYNDYLIAELEDDLNLQQRVALKTFMDAHPELEKEKLLFSKTILQKEVVVCPAKGQLKKHILVVRKNNSAALWIAVAAMILLLIGVYFIQGPDKTQVAQKQNKSNSQDIINNNTKIKNQTINPNTKDTNLQETTSLSFGEGQEGEANNIASNKPHHKKRKPVITPEKETRDNNIELAMLPAIKIESQLILSENEVMPEKTTVENITTSADKVNDATGEKILFSSSKTHYITEERMPLKSRIIKLVAWTVNKVSNNNVKVNTDFDVEGNLAAYQLSAGKFKVEKNF